MRTIDQYMSEYGESHTNPTNKLIHWICVPLILWSILGLLWAIPMPAAISSLVQVDGIGLVNVATLVYVLVLGFYVRLSIPLALGMMVEAGLMLGICFAIDRAFGAQVLAISSFAVFFVSWVFQFWGHKIEGKKPSFLKDLQFLLIGPLWVIAFLYRKTGIQY
jgi:uncharacterized membrane protein YGL010W